MTGISFKKTAGALGLAFMLAATGVTGSGTAEAARNTEPYSCTINGRIYDPQPSSVTIDAATGAILSGHQIDALRAPASLTKMMTAALIFDELRAGRLSLDDEITVRLSDDIRETRRNSRSTWLAEGATITVEEAILAIAVASANNVSVMMAETIAGSEANFVRRMNDKAAALGMESTVFENASGLPAESQVTTARDMAALARYLIRTYSEYYHYFSAPRAEFGPWRGERAKYNHNELAVRYNHIDGIKTGFICASGYNIAVSAREGGERVITLVFGGRTPHQRNELAKELVEDGLRLLRARERAPAPATGQNLSLS